MASTIEVLQEIQKVDLEIGKVEKEGSNYRNRISKVSAEVDILEAELTAATAEFDETDDIVKGINEEIRVNSEKIEKDEARVSEITSDKALKALTKEMGTARRVVKNAKERLDKIEPVGSEKSAVVEEKTVALEKLRLEIETMTEEMDAKGSEWEEVIAAKTIEREAVIKDLNPSVLKRYETIKSRRGGQGLAKVFNETCQGCFIHIPPQVYNILIKGTEELIACPNCHRILYFLKEASSSESV
ncbi:MAG: C4-type zinc ribbon domain-containing protein [Thermodesulfobacteriota bacterium]